MDGPILTRPGYTAMSELLIVGYVLPLSSGARARAPALAAVSPRRHSLRTTRAAPEQRAHAHVPQRVAARRIHVAAQYRHVGLRLWLAAERAERVEVRRQRASHASLGGGGGIGGGVHTRQTRGPRAEGAVALALDDDGEILCHSPASFRMRRARPVPTSFLVWTDTVITRPSGCTNWRWLPLPVRRSTKPAALRRRMSSPHVTSRL